MAEVVPALLTQFFDAFLSFVVHEETLHDVAASLLQRFFQVRRHTHTGSTRTRAHTEESSSCAVRSF